MALSLSLLLRLGAPRPTKSSKARFIHGHSPRVRVARNVRESIVSNSISPSHSYDQPQAVDNIRLQYSSGTRRDNVLKKRFDPPCWTASLSSHRGSLKESVPSRRSGPRCAQEVSRQPVGQWIDVFQTYCHTPTSALSRQEF